MDLTTPAILAATVLGFAFPAYLIRAIRSEEQADAGSSTTKACILFGTLVFLTLVLINS